jgi:glucose/arabinose dehydrogenase
MNKWILGLTLAAVIAAAGGLARWWSPVVGAAGVIQYFPVVFQAGANLPPADEASERISLPPGFAIRIFANNVSGRPRLMDFGPDGWLYVALINSNEVARLPDRNADGLADGVEVIAGGFNGPNNVDWHDGWLYVASNDRIDRLRDADGDGSFELREEVTTNLPTGGGHSSRTVHVSPDGLLYVSAGSSSNITPESDPRRAAILRFNLDGSIPADNPFATDPDARRQAVYAWGLRNSVDFLWSPGGQLWANHMGSDGLGDNLPPEELIIPVEMNRSHGWPYCYTPALGLNSALQPEVRDTRVALPAGFTCDQAVPALLTVEAHSAPLGMAAASGANFPPEYRDDIFVALHGSWNTNSPANYRDCKVQRVTIENGQVTGSETFANGWRGQNALCGNASTWGRPAGVAFGPDGALYISDDAAGRIYRVTYNP